MADHTGTPKKDYDSNGPRGQKETHTTHTNRGILSGGGSGREGTIMPLKVSDIKREKDRLIGESITHSWENSNMANWSISLPG